jgi:hypothetical protein
MDQTFIKIFVEVISVIIFLLQSVEAVWPFTRLVWRGVSKGVEEDCRLPALRVGRPQNGPKAFLGVACPQGLKGLEMVGLGETLGSLWILLAYGPAMNKVTDAFCYHDYQKLSFSTDANHICTVWWTNRCKSDRSWAYGVGSSKG